MMLVYPEYDRLPRLHRSALHNNSLFVYGEFPVQQKTFFILHDFVQPPLKGVFSTSRRSWAF
jgi:hypothetical protein